MTSKEIDAQPTARPGSRASAVLAGGASAAHPVRIVVDVHEAKSGIAEGLVAFGVTVRVARLEVGDYFIGPSCIVERKRVRDLHASVLRGRFWPQILAVGRSCRHPYLLIEGTDIDRGPLHPASVRSLCLAVIEQGIPVLRSYQQRDSAIWLYRLALRRQRRGLPRDRPPYAQRPKRRVDATVGEALLSSVPGISTKMARALLARFGTVADVVAAGPTAWLEVPGFGPTRVRSLEEALAAER